MMNCEYWIISIERIVVYKFESIKLFICTFFLLQLLSASIPNNLPNKQQVRHLNVHEYVSYTLLRDNGIPVPKFNVAKTTDEIVKFAQELNTKDIVLKAQVNIYHLICLLYNIILKLYLVFIRV